MISKEESSVIVSSEGRWKSQPHHLEARDFLEKLLSWGLHPPESSLVSLSGFVSTLTPLEEGAVTLMEDNGVPGTERCFNITQAFP